MTGDGDDVYFRFETGGGAAGSGCAETKLSSEGDGDQFSVSGIDWNASVGCMKVLMNIELSGLGSV